MITNFVFEFNSATRDNAASMFLLLPALIVKPKPKNIAPNSQFINISASSSILSIGTPAIISCSISSPRTAALRADISS